MKKKASGKLLHGTLVLCGDLEGGMGREGGREGGDMCILMADSHCHAAETNATL